MENGTGGSTFQIFIGKIILFGVYIGVFFLLSQTAFIDPNDNLFLEEFGVTFDATTE